MKKIYIAVAILLLAGVSGTAWYTNRPAATISFGPDQENIVSQAESSQTPVADKVEQTSGSASAQPQPIAEPLPVAEHERESAPTCDSVRILVESATYVVCIGAETTALAAMQNATREGLTFSGQEYPSLGFYIESIDGKKAENGYYWFLYINDVSSTEGASAARVQAGDRIEWRYKKSY